MASGLTPIYSLPYPLSTDGVDVAGDMEDLAQKVEEILSIKPNVNSANTFTGVNTFLVDSSSPALKITQTGSGPVVLFEDSTSTDSTPFVITSSGNVGIGTTAPTAGLHVASGEALFTTSTTFDEEVYFGTTLQDTNVFLRGNLQVTQLLETNNLYVINDFNFFESVGGFNFTITTPSVAATANRTFVLPDVNGTIITSGNPNNLYPAQSSNTGKVLTTDGTNASWQTSPNQVPSVTGQTGKWLSNDGSTYYWENLLLIPELDTAPDIGSAGKWLTNDGEEVYWDFLPGQEPFIEVSSDIVLAVGANLFCDTRGGNFSITLPDNPLPGVSVSVFDVQNFFQSEYVIINPGTEKINGIEGNLILDVGGATVVFIYINETIGWRVA